MTTSAPSVMTARHAQLREELLAADIPFLALNPGPSLTYLTGFHFHLSERPVVFVFPARGQPVIVLPELEAQKVKNATFELTSFTYGESLDSWGAAYNSALSTAGVADHRIGVEPVNMRVLELRLLEAAAPNAEFVAGDKVMSKLRVQKDEAEVALMEKATRIAETALQRTLPDVVEGVTEKRIAGILIGHMLSLGSGGELPFQPIIAFGANSANPHAVPTDYQLERGDLVLFDWGANVDGYFSDLTRMFCLGTPEDELRNIVGIVERANAAGRAAAAPGATAASVDHAARSTIASEGYGDFFVHRTGHGIGLEVHEPPYIRGDNGRVLEEGMTFTVEPGIYLNGRGGARIEDDMLIIAAGARSLSSIPRHLVILGE